MTEDNPEYQCAVEDAKLIRQAAMEITKGDSDAITAAVINSITALYVGTRTVGRLGDIAGK